MKIMVISDLHIGSEARCLSLIPEQEVSETDAGAINDNYLQHLEDIFIKEGIEIDYLIIAGDITNSGTYDQYKHFNDYVIHKILEITGLDIEKIFFTVGNHDSNWIGLKEEDLSTINKEKLRSRYVPVESYKILKSRLTQAKENLLDDPFYCIWETDDILVVSVNTAASDMPNEEIHHGEISKQTIDHLENNLVQNYSSDKKRIRIILLHHHPKTYENKAPAWRDFSILQCYKDLVEFSTNNKFDLVIHGHRHQPEFNHNLGSSSGHQIGILCGGSFSHRFPAFAYDYLSNVMHFVNIDTRDSETGVLCGEMLSYSFSQRSGWQKSTSRSCGIDHKIVFGPNEHRDVLYALIKKSITGTFDTKNVCKTFDVIDTNRQLKFINHRLIMEIVEEVCKEENFELIGREIHNSAILKGDVNE